jgi:lysyl oxidase
MGKVRAVVLLCAVAVATLIVLAVAASQPAEAATDQLPDLAMDKLTSIQIQNADGRRLLRFDTKVVDIGAGAFELHGSRPDTSTSDMTVTQRIFDDAGGYRNVPTSAAMYYSGDGHSHWHVRDLQTYTLTRLDNGVKVGTGAKEGFCFWDNYRFGSIAAPFYSGCANNQPNALSVKMGLSRGWGDIYGYNTVGQYIDLTNLTSGRYRLTVTADNANWFQESNESNNSTWANVQLKNNKVSVLSYGPSAQQISP